jgi:hypothetical protein
MADIYRPPVTPAEIELRLIEFMKANSSAYEWLEKSELEIAKLEVAYEVAKAKGYIDCDGLTNLEGKPWTVDRVKAQVTSDTAEQALALRIAEANLKAAKSRCKRIENDLEALRSLSASIRNSLSLGG